MPSLTQQMLFDSDEPSVVGRDSASSTFVDNMRLPVHGWIRYSAGFSAEWVQSVIREVGSGSAPRVFDPFAGSGTTLLAAEQLGIESCGVEAHPFVARMAEAKLAWRSDPESFRSLTKRIKVTASSMAVDLAPYPKLIRECYDHETLSGLDRLRQAVAALDDDSSSAKLAWLALTGILRKCSHAGTAQWQYILPKKSKSAPQSPDAAFDNLSRTMYRDMLGFADRSVPAAQLIRGDARTCEGVPDRFANLVVTSPPYPNNYDYADATRLEMSFFGELRSWSELQAKVRCHLLRSCSQHVPERTINLQEVLTDPVLDPIRAEIADVCGQLATIRLTKGGKKTYHLMVACYFLDLAKVWLSLRRVCDSPCNVCFVIGDSAPYGIYVPVIDWLGRLAIAAGFHSFRFEQTRERNVKWKNRKHRVPLCEGRLWVQG
jgi:hypothetical protein